MGTVSVYLLFHMLFLPCNNAPGVQIIGGVKDLVYDYVHCIAQYEKIKSRENMNSSGNTKSGLFMSLSSIDCIVSEA